MEKIKLVLILLLLGFTSKTFAQKFDLKMGSGIHPINLNVEEVKHRGKAALKISAIVNNKTAMVLIPGSDFTDGTIEFEMASNRAPDSHPMTRGFAGLAFHISPDTLMYDLIYLRATNGRADDQVRRNHTIQYMAMPDFDFQVLREKYPEKYETYTDVEPDAWMKIKIEVKDRVTKLYTNNQEQPVMVITDMLNPNPSGGIALWVGGGTVAYYRNLRLTKEK